MIAVMSNMPVILAEIKKVASPIMPMTVNFIKRITVEALGRYVFNRNFTIYTLIPMIAEQAAIYSIFFLRLGEKVQ